MRRRCRPALTTCSGRATSAVGDATRHRRASRGWVPCPACMGCLHRVCALPWPVNPAVPAATLGGCRAGDPATSACQSQEPASPAPCPPCSERLFVRAAHHPVHPGGPGLHRHPKVGICLELAAVARLQTSRYAAAARQLLPTRQRAAAARDGSALAFCGARAAHNASPPLDFAPLCPPG